MKNKKITHEEALRLSILKWEWIVKLKGENMTHKGDNVYESIPDLKPLVNGCGLCELYRELNESEESSCGDCPLTKLPTKLPTKQSDYWCGCERNDHPYHNWRSLYEDKDKGKKHEFAVEILNHLIKLRDA